MRYLKKINKLFAYCPYLKKIILIFTSFFILLSFVSLFYQYDQTRQTTYTLTNNLKEIHYPITETLLLRVLDIQQVKHASANRQGVITYQTSLILTINNLFLFYFCFLSLICFIYFAVYFSQRFFPYNENNLKNYKKIIRYSILTCLCLIFVFIPFSLYQTDIHQFKLSQTLDLLLGLIGFFILSSFIVCYLLSFIPKKFNHILTLLCVFLLLSGLLNTFLFTGDYGVMDRFSLSSIPESSSFISVAQLIAIIVINFFIIYKTFHHLEKVAQVTQTIFITVVLLCSFCFYNIFTERSAFFKIIPEVTQETLNKTLFSYSKNDKNIVVFLLDMFTGSHMPMMLKQFPELKTQLDGFTYFPNAVSSSNATIYSMPSVLAGEYYTIYNQNTRKDNRMQAQRDAYHSIAKSFYNEGFQPSFLSYPIQLRKDLIADQNLHWQDENSLFEEYFWENESYLNQSYKQTTLLFDLKQMVYFGLFKFVPALYFRNKVYTYADQERLKTYDKSTVLNHVSTLYSATHRFDLNETKPTFKFFHTMMTHFPYSLFYKDGKCHYFQDGTINKAANAIVQYQHYDTEMCALSLINHYIEELKKENIYDNTQIFILSDHAGTDSINVPKMLPRDFGQDILLLFKDFNQKGNLKTDERLMANYDISTIYCSVLKNGCPNVQKNILENYPQNRKLIHLIPNHWSIDSHQENKWLITDAYEVEKNIYQAQNWKNVKKQFANN